MSDICSNIILSVSEKVFWDEFSIYINGLGEVGFLFLMSVGLTQSIEGLNRKKKGGELILLRIKREFLFAYLCAEILAFSLPLDSD